MSEDDLSEITKIFKDAIEENPSPVQLKRQEQVSQINTTSLQQFPNKMSCTTAFDELFGCYSVGGQFKNYYRYGELNSCSDAYNKFTFCISNTLSRASDEEKQIAVQKFYKRDLMMKKAKGSSEDVWETR